MNLDDGEHSTDLFPGDAQASTAWAALDATTSPPDPLSRAVRVAAAEGLGMVHVAAHHLGPSARRALEDSLRAARGQVLVRTGAVPLGPGPGPAVLLEPPAGEPPVLGEHGPSPLDVLIRVDPALAASRAAAQALRQAGLPLAVSCEVDADAGAFFRWCATLSSPGPAAVSAPPHPLDPWVGGCPARASLAPRLWRLRRWARLALVSRHRDDTLRLARALWGERLVVARALPAELPGALEQAQGGVLLLTGLERAPEAVLVELEGALAEGGLRLAALLPEWAPHSAGRRLCLQPVELPAAPPAPPALTVVPPGTTPTDRALLRLPPLRAHDTLTVRTAAALLLGGRPLEDAAARVLARSAHGRTDLVATLAGLDRRLPAGPVTLQALRDHAPHLTGCADGQPWVVRIPVALGSGGPAVRQELTAPRLRFSAAPAPGRVAIEGLPECFTEGLELRRSPSGMVAWLREDLPPHAAVLARPLERVVALPVVPDGPVQLGQAGVLELSWAPGITVELELYADPHAAETRRPEPPEAQPLSPEECAVVLGAVVAAAEGALPWDEALPRELRRRVVDRAGRAAAGRLLTADPVGALASLLASPEGQGLRRGLGARIRSHEAAAALHARLPRRVRRLLPPIHQDTVLAAVPDE